MDLTLLISRISPFRNLVMLGGIFFFIQILIEHSVSKQWSPDQKPHSVASALGMHYLPRSHLKDAWLVWVKGDFCSNTIST